MKYILLILLFACGRVEKQNKPRAIIDSLPMVEGHFDVPKDRSRWGKIESYQFRLTIGGDYLYMKADSSIHIKGDTMKLIKFLLLQLEQKSFELEDLKKKIREENGALYAKQ